jgi:hypothetical protein
MSLPFDPIGLVASGWSTTSLLNLIKLTCIQCSRQSVSKGEGTPCELFSFRFVYAVLLDHAAEM